MVLSLTFSSFIFIRYVPSGSSARASCNVSERESIPEQRSLCFLNNSLHIYNAGWTPSQGFNNSVKQNLISLFLHERASDLICGKKSWIFTTIMRHFMTSLLSMLFTALALPTEWMSFICSWVTYVSSFQAWLMRLIMQCLQLIATVELIGVCL